MAFDSEDFAYPPTGGKLKMIVLGVLLPVIIVHYGVTAWLDQVAYWLGRHGSLYVRGEAAQAMAVVYWSVAAFIHFRWFWGMLHYYRVFDIGLVCSMIAFVSGLLWAFCVV